MQILVVYKKSSRQVVATFEFSNFVTEMNALLDSELTYLVSFKKDIFYTTPNGCVYVK